MSYLGNLPGVTSYALGVDRFSANGTGRTFTLSRVVDNPLSVEIHISGVWQAPTSAYLVNNGVLTFISTPTAGANNIVVVYRDSTVISYDAVATSQIEEGAVTASKLAAGAVTGAISSGQITGNLIATTSIRANQIVAGTITGNLIADTSIRGNQIATSTLTGNLFAANTITGDKIGQGAISANNLSPTIVTGGAYSNIAVYTIPNSTTTPTTFPFSIPATTTRMKVTIVGGGGGSGATVTGAPYSTQLSSGGGGGGGTVVAHLMGPFPSSMIVGIGAGGLGGIATPTEAPNGADGDQSYITNITFANSYPGIQTIRAAAGGGSRGTFLGPGNDTILSYGKGANTSAGGGATSTVIASNNSYQIFASNGYPGKPQARMSPVPAPAGYWSVSHNESDVGAQAGASQFGADKGRGGYAVYNSTSSGGVFPGLNGTPGIVVIEY